MFPPVAKGRKEVVISVEVNATYSIEVTVRYVCNRWLFYTLQNPTVSCVEGGFDNDFGRCVEGEIVLILNINDYKEFFKLVLIKCEIPSAQTKCFIL